MNHIETKTALVTRQQAADFPKFSTQTIDKLIRLGKLKSIKVGKNKVRLFKDDLKAYISNATN